MTRKQTGSYYTPKILTDFLVDHIFGKYMVNTNMRILEPSCGDCQFLTSLLNKRITQQINIDILDIDKVELQKAKSILANEENINVHSYHQDYLDFYLKKNNKYSLIIGNPPYIKKRNMQKKYIDRCELIHGKAKNYSDKITSTGSIKNIWPAFVKTAVMSLK